MKELFVYAVCVHVCVCVCVRVWKGEERTESVQDRERESVCVHRVRVCLCVRVFPHVCLRLCMCLSVSVWAYVSKLVDGREGAGDASPLTAMMRMMFGLSAAVTVHTTAAAATARYSKTRILPAAMYIPD